MAIVFSNGAKNAMLDAFETAVGTSAKLYIRTGAAPAATTDADSGTLLATMDLPSDWMSAASGGSKAKNGTWSDTADESGTAAHFRIKDSGATTVFMQGSISESGGGGDMILDNTDINTGQTVTVSTFTLSI